MSWKDLANADPILAAFGAERMRKGVAYLATVRRNGAPRVHPVTPIVGGERLYVFMEPTSPKGHDLRHDGRFALHTAVGDMSGSEGEFAISGIASLVGDPQVRADAVASAPYAPKERYVLFELDIDSAASTIYEQGGTPVRRRWERTEK